MSKEGVMAANDWDFEDAIEVFGDEIRKAFLQGGIDCRQQGGTGLNNTMVLRHNEDIPIVIVDGFWSYRDFAQRLLPQPGDPEQAELFT